MIKKTLMPVALALVLFASIGLVTAFALDSPSPAVSSSSEVADNVLNDRVETLLRTDVGLAGSIFRAHTRAGIVTLVGSVPDEHTLRRALDLASSMRGVREVRNSMEIDSPK